MMVIEISIISPCTSCTHLQNTRHLVMKHDLLYFRACLHGSGGPQVGQITRLGGVKK